MSYKIKQNPIAATNLLQLPLESANECSDDTFILRHPTKEKAIRLVAGSTIIALSAALI